MRGTRAYSGVDPFTGMGRTINVAAGVIQSDEPCMAEGLPVFSPGLIDLQVNGYYGHDLNDGELSAGQVEALSEALCRVGVAAYLPTLITANEANICQRLYAIQEAAEKLPYSRQMIAGVHIEGPSISSKDGPRGAHPREHIRSPSIEEFESWQEAAAGLVAMITIAPELDGAIDYLREIAKRGVIVALGHSDASEEDIYQAADAGARLSTHLGNGLAATLPRHPNAVWAQLAEDRLSASLILDGHHLPNSTAQVMIRAKGSERVVLVSDSVKFAGMAPGRYTSPIGGDVEVSGNGRVSISGTQFLAGSGFSLLKIVSNFSILTGLPFPVAVTMATKNPAQFLNRSVDLKPGKRADFILFDLDYDTGTAQPRDIIFGGESVMQ
ncbi:MAG: amidohydrolase family protein [Paracoccaceae bacterium]|nr:amidohydrolase family protein [Paracoccaceae bacterium]